MKFKEETKESMERRVQSLLLFFYIMNLLRASPLIFFGWFKFADPIFRLFGAQTAAMAEFTIGLLMLTLSIISLIFAFTSVKRIILHIILMIILVLLQFTLKFDYFQILFLIFFVAIIIAISKAKKSGALS